MRAVGIVCEYNPFHRGHLYQLRETRRRFEDAALVCCMSGDFVQRGEAALLTKFARAEAACRCGADLVFELPLPRCLSPAEGFAEGAVALLGGVGCTALSYGSESADAALHRSLAEALLREETAETIKRRMKADPALSYAAARQRVLLESVGEGARVLSDPNDILAVEYHKAILRLGAGMETAAVARLGAGHDSLGGGEVPSARELRERLGRGEELSDALPPDSLAVLERETRGGRIRDGGKLELLLRSRLYALEEEALLSLPDACGGAGARLWKTLRQGRSLEQTAWEASTRRYPRARMRRLLMQAALGVRAEDLGVLPPYARLLAANARGRAYLAAERENIHLPVVTKPAAVRRLGAEAERQFTLGADAHDLYRLQFVADDDTGRDADWRTGPFLV